MSQKKPQGKLKKLLAIGLIVLGVSVASDIVATVATYPTDTHKQVGRQLNEHTSKVANYSNLSEEDTRSFDELIRSSEAQYTMTAATIAGVISFVIYVYMVFFSYNRIRKQRLTDNARGANVLLVVAASGVAMIAHAGFEYLYAGFSSYGANFGFQLIGAAFGLVVIAVFTLLITMLAESRYERKHSFLVE